MDKQEIKCSICGKVLGFFDKETHLIINIIEDYNTCDKCDRDICKDCTVNIEELED